MKKVKRGFITITLLIVFLGSGYCDSVFKIQHPDSLYRRALKSKDFSKGIKLAKQACQQAKIKNDKIILIKGLNLVAEDFWEDGINDSAQFYGNYSIQLSNKYHVDSLKANTLVILGLVDYRNGNYEFAIKKYNIAGEIYQKENKLLGLAVIYKNIGICENQLSRNTESIKYLLKGVKIFQVVKDSSNLASSYNSIAFCFESLNNYSKAIDYNKKALIIRQKLHDSRKIAQSYNNIGFGFKESNQPDSAISYLLKSIELYRKQQDSSLLVLPLQNLASTYKIKHKLNLSDRYIQRSLIIASNYSMKEEMARGNLDLCEILMEEKKYAPALTAVNVTEAVATELKLPELLMQADDDKYKLYRQTGNYKNALYYETQKENLKDSIFSVAKDKAINELEIKYQVNLKERDIATLNLQNKLQTKTVAQQKFSIVVLIIGAVLLSLLFSIAYNSYLQKNKANIRIQHLMQELHHRVKNNLQIMSSLLTIQIENLSDEATKAALRENEARMASMNLIHNQLYQNYSGTQINIESYLSKLLHHIKSTFGGDREKNISLRLEVEPLMIEADKAVAIGLIVNELATNAFKYAFDGKTGEIYLGLKQEGKSKILLSLGDNGKGIKKENQDKEISFGLKLVNLMTRQLNSKLIAESANGTFYRMEISL